MGHEIEHDGVVKICENSRCCEPYSGDLPFCGPCWGDLPAETADRVVRALYRLAAEVRVAVGHLDRSDAKFAADDAAEAVQE